MKIRMRQTAAGPSGVFDAGREYDVASSIGMPLVEGNAAVWLDRPLRLESAMIEAPERAIRPAASARRGR